MLSKTCGWSKWRIMGIAILSFIIMQWIFSAWIYPSTYRILRTPNPIFSPASGDQQNTSDLRKKSKDTLSISDTTSVSSQVRSLNKDNVPISTATGTETGTYMPSVLNRSDATISSSITKKKHHNSPTSVYLLYVRQNQLCDKQGSHATHLCQDKLTRRNVSGLQDIKMDSDIHMASSRNSSKWTNAMINAMRPKLPKEKETLYETDGQISLWSTAVGKDNHQESDNHNQNRPLHEVLLSTPDYSGVSARTKCRIAMLERRKRVQSICRRYRSVLMRFQNHNRLLFDTKHHVAYCRNAKAGTTTWLSFILNANGITSENMKADEIHEAAMKIFPPLPSKLASKEMKHHHLLFTSVRHPFTRLVSAYRDKIPENYREDIQQKMISKYRNKAIAYMDDKTRSQDPSQPSFREFILYVSEEILACDIMINSACLDQVDTHWRPYYDRCAPCDLHYDIIAKARWMLKSPAVETLSDDEKCIRQISGLSPEFGMNPKNQTHRHASAGPSSKSLAQIYFSHLTPEEKHKVYEAYYFDFILFGYDPVVIT
ncbi:hypothetical protein SK128_028616 [Halocaridina rubra]|uniref:Carbohydrate sulfotransferase n=1 Tax=Halocaridina rubra TaxID=373956 RepID=A0AAN9A1J5_HALRR